MGYMERYEEWLKKLPEDHPFHAELLAIKGDDAEIKDRFYKEIEFGTAGLRGIFGAGTNRMNEFTVGRATQGIANYILNSGEDVNRGFVLAYDSRYNSKEFAQLAAEILAGNGIKAYLFPSLRPTPELSFAIRSFAALGGINMTASHNPKEYNGYKVYWMDGAQISGEISDGMLKEILALDLFDDFKKIPLEEAIEERKVRMLGEEMDLAYLDYVVSMRQRTGDSAQMMRSTGRSRSFTRRLTARAASRCRNWRRIWAMSTFILFPSRRIPIRNLRLWAIPIRRIPRHLLSQKSLAGKSGRRS